MHKLLIVDDDEILRSAVLQNIDWESNGIRVVATARNGQECLDKLKSCSPDVILSDIMMPFVDGLQLAEIIYKLYPQIKLVLLTAYDDFEYARKALNYKVNQYVMKYEENSKILESVLAACEEHDRQKSNSDMVDKSRELLKNEFLNDLIVNGKIHEKQIENYKRLGIEFCGTRFCTAVLNPAQYVLKTSDKKTLETEMITQRAKSIVDNYLISDRTPAYSFISNSHLNVLFNFTEDYEAAEDWVLDYMTGILGKTYSLAGIEMTACLGNIYKGFENIPKSYSEAIQLMEMRGLFYEENNNRANVISMKQVYNQSESQHILFTQIVDYINENYRREDFSLNLVSQYVHVSAAYISTLFKKCKGINFSEYLTDIRMKKAMELLKNTTLKTYDISEKIGYANSQYFSVLFKKYTGCTPTEYRQSI